MNEATNTDAAGGPAAPTAPTKKEYLDCLASLPEFASEIEAFTHMSDDDIFKQVALHIDTHKYFLERNIPIAISLQKATWSWCRNVYLPLITAMEETGAEKIFPALSRIELFMKISDHMYYLLEEKKRIEIYNHGQGKSAEECARIASYVFIPFNQVVYSYISLYAPHWLRRFLAKFRLTKVRSRPKLWA